MVINRKQCGNINQNAVYVDEAVSQVVSPSAEAASPNITFARSCVAPIGGIAASPLVCPWKLGTKLRIPLQQPSKSFIAPAFNRDCT